jgi:amidohydrolase
LEAMIDAYVEVNKDFQIRPGRPSITHANFMRAVSGHWTLRQSDRVCRMNRKPGLALIFLATTSFGQPSTADDYRTLVDPQVPELVAVYKDLHAHPELSLHEERTSALLAAELRKAGFAVTERVGKYAQGGVGYGVVAILKNGAGPTVLVRTDMDALPVEEMTGLPYASHVHTKDDTGNTVGVMHACGHDLHMACFLGTARTLASLKDRWRGTLMLIGQPAEERVGGARAMLADNLYERFGRPDFCIAMHDNPEVAAGQVAVVAGPLLSSAAGVDVTIRGVGGHGSRPEATKDPIVIAAQFVMALQTIVSRQTDPQEPAVVTVGSIHGGTKRNIIPDEVKLEISTRAFSEGVQRHTLAVIERTARGIALAAGVPEDRMPIVKAVDGDGTPVTYNDPGLAGRLKNSLRSALGTENVLDGKRIMASEDFGLFGLEGRQIPIFMLWLGAAQPDKLKDSLRTGVPLPSLHSSLFYPIPEPAIRAGVTAMSSSVVELMKQ